jgi:transcriptional regulator with XRE-family HTH domain
MGFAENLNDRLNRKGWKPSDLAAALKHSSQSTAYRWAKPGNPPTGDVLIQMAKVLGCSVEDLLIDVDPAYDAMQAARSAETVPGLDAQERTVLAQLRAIATFRRQELDAYLHWFRYRLMTVTEDPAVLEAVDVDPIYASWCEMYGTLTAEQRTSAFHMFSGKPQAPASPARTPAARTNKRR